MTTGGVHHQEKGSVILVAMCFVAVLGIALASYLTVSNQAMRLSNRSYQQSVSRQLAEMGLEQTLQSFNQNKWDPAIWAITGTTATRTITFPATKYGNGVIGSIKVRVDNYDAYNRSSTWSATTTYSSGDLVGYNGMWYRGLQNNNLNHSPSIAGELKYWAPAPMPCAWSPNTTYKKSSASEAGSVVYYVSNWFLCINDTTGPSFNASDWKVIPVLSLSWNSSTNYPDGSFVFSGGTWYRSTNNTNTGNPPPDPSFWSTGPPYLPWSYRGGVTYNFNDLLYGTYSGVDSWFRHTSTAPTTPPTGWENALSASWAWSSSVPYNLNDVVYIGGNFYRCVRPHSNQSPPNSTYWSNSPLLSPTWNAMHQYRANDVVSYEGEWYLDLGFAVNQGKVPATSPTYWALAPQSLQAWEPTKNYNVGDRVNNGGFWYRCIAANLNQATSNTSFWVGIAEASRQWDPAVSYPPNSYVSYGGVWYRCILATMTESPNNSLYWTPLGAPVIYAEGTAILPDGSTAIKTQLRATPAKASLFPNAAAATSTLKINGAGRMDSYNSFTDPLSDPTYPGSTAVLASTATSSPAITVTGTTVNGYVAAPSSSTSPFNPLWNYGGSAVLTGAPAGTGIDLTRVSRSPYIPRFDTLPKPDLSAAFPFNFPKGTVIAEPDSSVANSTLILGTPGAVTPSVYSYDGNFNLQASSTNFYKTIIINGPVILYINGYLRIRPGCGIDIKKTGSAEIHCSYVRTYSGSDGIFNRTQDPKKLIVIADGSTASNTYLDNGSSLVNSNFCGALYAPNTTATLGLEIRTGMKIYGALLARKITFSDEATLHYDTSLRHATFGGVDSPFVISQWRELTDLKEKANFP